MAGALLTMPLLVMNMGGEMIYILAQRLNAQKIDNTKAQKVLGDVVKTMFNSRFVNELFKPQHIYSTASTRKIFDRLAHSSIMRLNTNSMDKLYDLMTMGFKYQVLSCSSPDIVLQVTLNHLNNLKTIAPAPDAIELLNSAIIKSTETYGPLGIGDFQSIRQHLLMFFQDKHVKVSLFLQDKCQLTDGTLVLRSDGIVATGADIPGTIKYFDKNGRKTHTETFEIESSLGAIENTYSNIMERELSTCPYGRNMYAGKNSARRDSGKVSETPASLAAAAAGKDEKKSAAIPPGGSAIRHYSSAKSTSPSSSSSFDSGPKITGIQEMNVLADLLGGAVKEAEDYKPFKISLFTDDGDYKDGDIENASFVRTINIDASDRKTAKNDFDDFDADLKAQDKKGGSDDDDDDLLALMDST